MGFNSGFKGLSQLEGEWRGRGGSVYKAGCEGVMTHMEVAGGYGSCQGGPWDGRSKLLCCRRYYKPSCILSLLSHHACFYIYFIQTKSCTLFKTHSHFYLYLSGLVTAVAVFRNPNTIPFCLTTDLLLNVLFSWLLVHLQSTFFLDVLISHIKL